MNPKLREAVQDAQTLLAHAAQTGKSLDPTIIAIVVTTGSICESGSVTDKQESDFWGAFDTLSKAVNPVSVSSLHATMDSLTPIDAGLFGLNAKRGSLARRAVRWYTGIAILSLLVLLLFQIYWLFGTAITGGILRVKKDYDETVAKIAAYKGGITHSQANKPTLLDSRSEAELEALNDHKDNLMMEGETIYNLLEVWSKPWEDKNMLNISCKNNGTEDLGLVKACTNIARNYAAVEVLNVLQRYPLPLLYGLLGACVYILRTLSSQIRARTYSESSNIDFRIRLYLGTLGGMVSAWFLTPEVADGVFKSISPFALAFLAGYSIELVFAAMDRIISAFTKQPEKAN